MKRLLIAIIFTASLKAFAGADGAVQTAVNPMNGDASGNAALRQQMKLNNQYARQEAAQEARTAAEMAELNALYAKDPWRNIGGATNVARGPGWCEFQGYGLVFRDGGVIFKGSYGNVLTVHPSGNAPNVFYGNDLFFVENFPYPARRRVGYDSMMAHFEGFYSYKSPSGQPIQIKKFDYGTPCIKVWSPEEIAANQKKMDDQKQAVVDKVSKITRTSPTRAIPMG